VAAVSVLTVAAGLVPMGEDLGGLGARAYAAPVGQGFNLNPSDLKFILAQIKIAEHHAENFNAQDPCAGLVGPGPNQIPVGGNSVELPWGLRTVDGTCNNLLPEQTKFGAADQKFPRRVSQPHLDGAEAVTFDTDGPGPETVGGSTTYQQTNGSVFDSQPRVISNLVVDQTAANPAAVAAAGPGAVADPATGTLPIPNVAPDVGLSAPYNSVFTFFGQFFDHGLDLVAKGGNGTVYMPLKEDDPLYVPGSHTNFMAVSRATMIPGTHEATNLTTPFVDQNQTYSSHPAHQVFLREYVRNGAGRPVSTGRLLEGSAGGQATWTDVKNQARTLLGIELDDQDVLNVPLLATDPYGRFIPDKTTGFPQLVTANGLKSGTPAAPVDASLALRTGHAFLDDIAHHAVPFGDPTGRGGPGRALTADSGTADATNPVADDNNPATYDDEMLGAHFVAGDGRVNENIGLTSIHHVFHSEHNRLAGAPAVPGSIKNVLVNEDPASVAEWQLPDGSWNGERIFQAAKFVTEMEYQHLVFEEFARKVQPMVNAFGEGGVGYDTSINPAIKAEFAHAVYRFGHSMLTETVARRNADGTRNDVPLLDAFLNPQEFTDGGPTGALTADEAAGSVFRGMSRQRGNEIDEFVTAALRSNLLGLPLDLAAINMARARETGTPTLNEARRQFFAESNNSQVKPYDSWVDLGYSLRHPESLVNFVAAYGTHPSLAGPDQEVGTSDDTATTLVAKRRAAQLLVDGDASNPATPADAVDFMNGTGTWSGTETGLDDIDLWVGGLAERPMIFGGLLGSTFNYVFELQLESLQFGDRFYYLSRTAGLNLLTQLEGNSFAELVMRNTDVEGLPADAFSRPDLVFNVGKLGATGPVLDDASTEDYDESKMLTRNQVNGTIRFAGPEHTVWNGTAGADRLWSSEGDDTIRGNDGADWMQGGDGVDNLIGGLGDDHLEDLFGDDTLKGGDGADFLSSGQGFGGDLNQGGRGKDFIVSGNDITETFGGPGNDFVLGGDDSDTVFGDDGDDWIEGGKGPFNLLQGDNGAPFQNDPNAPGNDVIDGDGGEQDFDSEGGDDIMLMGPGIQRAEGMDGFDWSTHQGDPLPGDSDMLFTGLMPPSVAALRDRFDLVEGLSGWRLDDTLRGDGVTVPAAGAADPADPEVPEAPAPEPGVNPANQVLTQAGIARIDGLAALLPAGTTSFSAGNIILGGGGDDVVEGRGEDDIIDGDKWLSVALRVPDLSTPAVGDTKLVNGLSELTNDVSAGRLDPSDFSIVRRVLTAPAADSADDTAVYSDPRINYDCSINGGPFQIGGCQVDLPAGATVTIRHAAGTQADGTDTLTGIEHLMFSDTTAPGVPTAVTASPHNSSATVKWTPGRGTVTGYWVKVLNGAGQQVGAERRAAAGATDLRVTGLTNGQSYRFQVRAENAAGTSDWSLPSNAVTPAATESTSPTIGLAVPGDGRVTVHWTGPADDGGSPITAYKVRVTDAANRQVGAPREAPPTATELTVTGLTNGQRYWFEVFAVNAVGTSLASAESTTTPGTPPGAARIGTASAGDSSAMVRWLAPRDSGGLGVTDYRVKVVDDSGAQLGSVRNASAAATQLRVRGLSNGETYRFQVAAVNEMGVGRFSRPSNPVVPGTRPAAPVVLRPEAGPKGGARTVTARWKPAATASVPAITSYQVTALQVASEKPGAKVLRHFRSPVLEPGRRTFRFVLPEGTYRIEVVAFNAIGRSAASERSQAVRAR